MARRIAISRAMALASVRADFEASNLYGTSERNGWYVVYSYGSHWPLHAYNEELDMWFSNTDKYSTSTSRHFSQTQPRSSINITSEEMLHIIRKPLSEIRGINSNLDFAIRKNNDKKIVKRSAEPVLRGGELPEEDE